jgi:hypothetical protein
MKWNVRSNEGLTNRGKSQERPRILTADIITNLELKKNI